MACLTQDCCFKWLVQSGGSRLASDIYCMVFGLAGSRFWLGNTRLVSTQCWHAFHFRNVQCLFQSLSSWMALLLWFPISQLPCERFLQFLLLTGQIRSRAAHEKCIVLCILMTNSCERARNPSILCCCVDILLKWHFSVVQFDCLTIMEPFSMNLLLASSSCTFCMVILAHKQKLCDTHSVS